jgi:hypothetical protein
MANFLKHVGQTIDTNKKCVVVFRSLPDEPDQCLIVETEALPPVYHDYLIEAVESPNAQQEMDFYNYAGRSNFQDGSNMLQALHKYGLLRKRNVDQIEMLPTPGVVINLRELNNQLSQLNGEQAQAQANTKQAGVLSDSDIANQMRSQAAFFLKEAKRLSGEADKLDPTTGLTTIPTTETSTDEEAVDESTGEVKKSRGRPKKNN